MCAPPSIQRKHTVLWRNDANHPNLARKSSWEMRSPGMIGTRRYVRESGRRGEMERKSHLFRQRYRREELENYADPPFDVLDAGTERQGNALLMYTSLLKPKSTQFLCLG